MAHEVRQGEIVIEIDEERGETKWFDEIKLSDDHNLIRRKTDPRRIVVGNSEKFFFPIQRTVRSRMEWFRHGRKYRLDDAVYDLPALPGERIHIDLEKRIGRITDAMGDPVNEQLLIRAVRAAKSMEDGAFNYILRDEETVSLTTDTAFYTWLFWMRRIVDEGCAGEDERKRLRDDERGPSYSFMCRDVQDVNRLPSLKEIVSSNRVKITYNEEDPRTQEALDKQRKRDEPGYVPGMLSPALMGM